MNNEQRKIRGIGGFCQLEFSNYWYKEIAYGRGGLSMCALPHIELPASTRAGKPAWKNTLFEPEKFEQVSLFGQDNDDDI